METLNRFQAVDIILEYIDRPEHHNQMFDAENIQKELFPNDQVDTVQFLFEFIDTCGINPPIAKLESETYIYRTVHTKHFLDDGGFTKVHNESLNKAERQNEIENLELQQLRTNVKILTDQHIDYLKDRKRFIRNEWALWIGILLSLIAIIISISSKK